jgi:transposase InsO family protein
LIQQWASQYPVARLCPALGVSASGYYAWINRAPSQRWLRDRELKPLIRQAYQTGRRAYGSPRVLAELQDQGQRCSGKRIARLMREEGLRAEPRRRYIVTTESGGTTTAAPNLLARQFDPGGRPAWLADLTYIHTGEGFLYLALVMQLASRRVIGFSLGNQPSGQLALDALQMALGQASPVPGQLHHSDRGGHYAALNYQELLKRHGLEISMSRKGDCWDNAVVESFFASLKRELVYPQQFRTRGSARQQIFEYIEVFYNRIRRHSSLGNLSPIAYEKIQDVP